MGANIRSKSERFRLGIPTNSLPLIDDGVKLWRDFGILANNLVELGGLAQQADPAFHTTYKRSLVSLARMVDMYLDKSIDKGGAVRMGDWDAAPLDEEQRTCQ